MANTQNQKNRDDVTTNNQANNAQRTQDKRDQTTMQQGKDQRTTGSGAQGPGQGQDQGRKNAPGRQDHSRR